VPFADLNLHPNLLKGIKELGFARPTPIQADSIPPALEGRDLLACAMTGSGKTAAFVLPILQRLIDTKRGTTRALILSPTRELALQILEDINDLAVHTPVTAAAVYGGVGMGPQEHALRSGVDIVVATPGRAIDLMNRGALRLDELEVVVLDEADEMLDMGFVEDIETLLDATPDTRQAVLVAATMPRRIEDLARNYLREPVTVRIRREVVPEGEAPLVRQTAYLVPRTHTTAALGRVLEAERPKAAIVFCRTRLDVDALACQAKVRDLDQREAGIRW